MRPFFFEAKGVFMSGHSKWATIKHKKGALDAKRGQLFTKLIKEISIAARMGGGDIDGNPRLRTAVLKARAANMPKDNIDRAIKKGTGELAGVTYEELFYEAYTPGGGAMLIEVLTDNKNRAAAEIRNIVTRSGSNLGTTGSVAYLFKRKGVLTYDIEKYTEDQILEAALDAGADDVVNEEDSIVVYTDPASFESVLNAMNAKNFETLGAEVSMVPETYISVDVDTAQKIQKLIDRLEENEDVQNVYHNIDMPELEE